MIKTIPQILANAESLLNNRKYEKALKVLGEIDTNSISPDDKSSRDLLMVEANLFLGNFNIREIIDNLVAYYRDKTDNNKFARAKFMQGWLLASMGQYFDAKEVLLESYVLYKRHGNSRGEARTLNRLGFISYHIGEIKSAIDYLKRCINIYDQNRDYIRKSHVMANLAQLYYSLGYIRDAINLNIEVKALILNQDTEAVGIFHFMSAVPYAALGDFNMAKHSIEKSKSFIKGFNREKAIHYENLGWIHLLEGDYSNAERALLKGLEISLDIAPESALISQIKRRLGDAYFGLGKYEQARKYTDEGLAVAQKLNERVEIAACYRVYAQLECKNRSDDVARDWFGKAIDLFAMIGSRYELAVTRYLAAMSGLYLNGERQALLYMAREYFQSEDVTQYVEKINREIKRVRVVPVNNHDYGDEGAPAVITVNYRMKRIVELAEHVAPSKMSVLLTGATGTGKDLLAQFIHYHSGRKGSFVSVNAAAIPDNMIESELFGYKKGAYTGAERTTIGMIEGAEGGTFYLNEVADASPEMQAKLLDVLETRAVRLLGGRANRRIDFRVIAATNHDLEKLIRDGKFRADLYHRLKEIPINIPPLSDRLDDIPALLKHFLKLSEASQQLSGSSQDMDRLASVLSAFDWPGNIREFKAQVERLALIARGDIRQMTDIAAQSNASERDQLLILLSRTKWNRSQVAKILGIAEGTVRHRIKKYKITPENDS